MWADDTVCLKCSSALSQFDVSNFKTKHVLVPHPHADVVQKTGADELVSRRVRARRRPQRSAAVAGGSAAGGLECPAGWAERPVVVLPDVVDVVTVQHANRDLYGGVKMLRQPFHSQVQKLNVWVR